MDAMEELLEAVRNAAPMNPVDFADLASLGTPREGYAVVADGKIVATGKSPREAMEKATKRKTRSFPVLVDLSFDYSRHCFF